MNSFVCLCDGETCSLFLQEALKSRLEVCLTYLDRKTTIVRSSNRAFARYDQLACTVRSLGSRPTAAVRQSDVRPVEN